MDKSTPARKREADQSDDFTQVILRLKLSKTDEPLLVLSDVRKRGNDLTQYRSQYIPLVIDDARASIEAGIRLRHVDSYLTLTEDVREPSGDNPWIMNCRGTLNGIEDGALSMNLVIMHCSLKGSKSTFIALANISRENTSSIKVKAMFSKGVFNHNKDLFERGIRWTAQYITNLTTHERIFNTCKSLSDTALVRKIMSGTAFEVPRLAQTAPTTLPTNGGNDIQNRAIQVFCNMPENNVMLLQGPPGTGKTTTVVRLLAELAPTRRVMVCAASNKAVQVLAERFHKDHAAVRMVLVGVEGKIPENLRAISFYALVPGWIKAVSGLKMWIDQLYNGDVKKNFVVNIENLLHNLPAAVQSMNRQKAWTTSLRDAYTPVTQSLKAAIALLPAIAPFSRELVESLRKLSAALQPFMLALEQDREQMELNILNHAQVIFCTLSSAGSSAFCGTRSTLRSGAAKATRPERASMKTVDVLIVDEAGQTVEAETLIPLQHNPRRVLLVGDTNQLPATVISQTAKDHFYDWSMMHRLQVECRQPKIMLTTQYRMHPEICAFPSRQYYGGQLVSASTCTRYTPLPNNLYQPVAFYDMTAKDNREQKDGSSWYNTKEVEYVAECVSYLRREHSDKTIGVITFYDAQRKRIVEKLETPLPANVVVGSVDGFQGSECDVIILSFVRHNRTGNVGFVDDFRRLNVAITRAKDGLIMIGCAKTLSKYSTELSALISHTKATTCFHPETALSARLGLVDATQPPSQSGKKGKAQPRSGEKAAAPEPAAPAPPTAGHPRSGPPRPPTPPRPRSGGGKQGGARAAPADGTVGEAPKPRSKKPFWVKNKKQGSGTDR